MKTIKLLTALFAANILICACNNDSSANRRNDEMSRLAEQLKKDYFGLATSDLEKSGYNGKVKSVKRTTYNAYSKFGDIVIDTIISQKHVKYNEDGYITYNYYLDKNHYKGTYSYEYTYTYENSDGKSVINCFKDDTLFEKTVKSLNSRNFPIQTDIYNSNGELSGRTKYKYEESGRLLEKTTYNSDGRTSLRLNGIKYDKNGFTSEYTEYKYSYNDNKKEESIAIQQFEYDEFGKILNDVVTIDGKKYYQVSLTYNGDKVSSYTHTSFIEGEESFKIESRHYGNYSESLLQMKDEKPKKSRDEYEHDSKENIIKNSSYENDEPTSVTIIEFEYYE